MTLFMTEVRVSDPRGLARWYADVLGLRVVLRDEPNGFALLEAEGGGRIALKGRDGADVGPDRFRLVFLVDDVEAERTRLLGLGVAAGEPTANVEEHYREVRLTDPEGTPVSLFSWEGR